jgi:hypothetical protein
MNSSTSTSKPVTWRRVLGLYAAACVFLFSFAAVLLIGLDPYDTGRFGFAEGYGVPSPLGPRLTAASTARAPEAEGAIIGNSTVELLDPARLSAATGIRFVSLAIPGTGPREQLTVARWFLSHHPGVGNGAPRAIVFGLDRSWCEGDGRLKLANPFPFWLYSPNVFDYVRGMLQMRTVESAHRKIELILGRESPLRPDGYSDYENGVVWNSAAAERASARTDDGQIEASEPPNFAAVALLRNFFGELAANTKVILLLPPRYVSSLPAAGSPAAQIEGECKASYRRLVDSRTRTKLIDFAIDNELARSNLNFWDLIHYRATVARQIEATITAALQPKPPD